jgi:hypothetical protein
MSEADDLTGSQQPESYSVQDGGTMSLVSPRPNTAHTRALYALSLLLLDLFMLLLLLALLLFWLRSHRVLCQGEQVILPVGHLERSKRAG